MYFCKGSWSGLLDSNQRPRAPQTCALPTAPNPETCLVGAKILQSFGMSKLIMSFYEFHHWKF